MHQSSTHTQWGEKHKDKRSGRSNKKPAQQSALREVSSSTQTHTHHGSPLVAEALMHTRVRARGHVPSSSRA